MPETNHFIVDIETCPRETEGYEDLSEEDRKKLLNPMDSDIVAIGIRHSGKNMIFHSQDERDMLQKFWNEWKNIKKLNPGAKAVGFNIKMFDLPFIVSKSFVHNVKISSFFVKEIIDVREKINAYRPAPSRGTLKEYASLVGHEIMDIDGKDIYRLIAEKKFDRIREYLEKDLVLTDKLYQRLKDTNILYIDRW